MLPLLLSLGVFLANAVILLSDRAPGLLRRLSARVDAEVDRAAGAAGVDAPRGGVQVPQSDFDVHVLIWAVAALLVGLAAWSWLTLLLGSAGVYSASIVLELAQGRYSRTRSVQFDDLVGNGIGVLVGTGLVAMFAVLWWAGTRRSVPRL